MFTGTVALVMGQTCNHLQQLYKQEHRKHLTSAHKQYLSRFTESCWEQGSESCRKLLEMSCSANDADLITCIGLNRHTNTKHYLIIRRHYTTVFGAFFWRNMKVFFSHVTLHHNYVSGRCCLLTNIHGKYSWIQRYSRGSGWHRPAAVANKSSDKSALWKSTNPEFGNPQIHTKAVHKCSLWKIVTKADSAKLAQKLSWVSAVPSRQPPSA